MKNAIVHVLVIGRLSLTLLCCIAGLSIQCCSEELPSAFNGMDFTGWEQPPKNIWWSVDNGKLRAKSDEHKRGSILWTEKKYGNFVMEFEFRFGSGTIDSGIFLRHENDQIQIGTSGSLKRDMTGSPYIMSERDYPTEAKGVKKLLKLNNWNVMTIIAKGSHYSVWLNNKHIMEYTSASSIDTGPIGIQLHPGRHMEIEFRKIKLAELN